MWDASVPRTRLEDEVDRLHSVKPWGKDSQSKKDLFDQDVEHQMRDFSETIRLNVVMLHADTGLYSPGKNRGRKAKQEC